MTVLPDVNEYDFGHMAGATYAEVRQHFGALSEAPVGPQDRVYPGEEGRENFARRVTAALWGVIESHPEETAAVISHGGPIALFCQAVLGLPYRRPMPFVISNGSLAIIEATAGGADSRGRSATLCALNDVCHLR
jgi:broad specificity phosphatase PhoE